MKAAPLGWFATAISEVAQVVGGGTPPSKDEKCFAPPGQGIPWLTPADLSGYKRQAISRGSRDLTPEGLAACSAKVMPAGAVLFSSRAPVGYVVIASNPVATNQGFKSFVFAQDIDSRFAYYQLKHIKPIAEALATGTTFKELSGSAAEKLPFLVAPAAEQKRIADKLDTVLTRVDAVSARLARVAPILKRFRQSVLAAATSGRLTEGWRDRSKVLDPSIFALGDLVASIDQGWSPKCESSAAPAERWAVIKTTAIQPLNFHPEENKALPNSLDPRPRLALEDGDVLITRAGPRSRAGIACLVRGAYPRLMLCDKAYRMRVDRSKIHPQMLNLLLNSPEVLEAIDGMKTGISESGVNLTQVRFRELVLSVPHIDEQAEIVRRVDTLFAFADRLEARLKAAEVAAGRLTPALLAKAFRGELVPQDPDDEPASELLRRLQAASGHRATARAAGRGRKRSI